MRPHSLSRPSRGLRGLPWALLTGLLLAACYWSDPPAQEVPPEDSDDLAPGPAVVPAGATVVGFSLADTNATALSITDLLDKYGMHATVYVNSGRIGRSGYLTLDQLRTLAAKGHEVGSHTVDHVDLDTLSAAEARHQICDDRAALMSLGFPVVSFAYPFSSSSSTARQIVIDCNFNNARNVGGIRNPYGCSDCPVAESIPPADVFHIRVPTSVKRDWTLADLQSLVLQTEAAGGGWMMLSLHGLCSGTGPCSDEYDIPATLMDSFLAWLAPRSSRGTIVLTTNEVIGGPVKPPVLSDGGTFDAGTFDAGTPPDAGAPDAGTPDAGTPDAGTPDAGAPDAGTPDAGTDAGTPVSIPLVNPSLEADSDSNNVPDCWKRQNLGSTSGGWLRTTEAHTGSWAQRARISSYSSGDRRLVVAQDSGTCARPAIPGRTYRVSAWYRTDSRAAFVASYRTSSGTWVNWATGPDLPKSSTYVRGEWVTPPLPAGATHLSVGLGLRGVGSAFMDDFTLEVLPGP